MDLSAVEIKLRGIKAAFTEKYIPPDMCGEFMREAFLAGGCIYSLYQGKEVKDYDFFLKSAKFRDKLVKRLEGIPGVLRTKYALSFEKGKYQIVLKYIGKPQDVVGEFDFRHNMFYYDDGAITGLVDEEYLQTRKLSFNDDRARDICGVLLRIPQFISRGMTITKKEHAAIIMKLNNGLDEGEREILNNASHY
jgi:hypothetical protein